MLMELPLRVQVLMAQERAAVWKGNLYSIHEQVEYTYTSHTLPYLSLVVEDQAAVDRCLPVVIHFIGKRV